MARKCVAVPTIDIVQFIVNQRQRKREIATHCKPETKKTGRNKQALSVCLAATLVFVQVTETFNR